MQKLIPTQGDGMDVEAKEESWELYLGNSMSQFPANVERPCGLRNLGNTCYMNSIVQSLAHVKPISVFLFSDWIAVTSPGAGTFPNTDSAIARRRFNEGLAETVRIIWSGKQRDYICRSLMKAVFDTIPDFRVHGQQDAEEALTYTLNNLHDDLFVPVPKELHPAFSIVSKLEAERKQLDDDARARGLKVDGGDDVLRRKKEEEARITQAYEPYKRSIVSDTFQGLLAQRVKCSRCESTSLTVQECFTVPLELPSKVQTKAQNGSGVPDGRAPSTAKSTATLKSSPSNSSLDPGSPKGPSLQEGTSSGTPGLLSSAWQTLKSTFSFGHALELEQCLRSFFSSEILKGEEQYYCENCKAKEDATKTHELIHLPEVLCLQLKRFNKNRGTFGLASAKNSTTVRFPVEGLDLSPYCSGDACQGSTTYDLISVVRHSGGANSGHYIATCKSPVQGKWFEFDDEFVSPVASTDALQSSDAYLLFYARRPSDDDQDRKDKAMKALRGASSTHEATRLYISRYWALKFETMSQPGPVDNWAFACEHGGVTMPVIKAGTRDAHERAAQRVVALPARVLDELAKIYGGLSPVNPVRSLDPCEPCRQMFEALAARRLGEGEEYTELEGNNNGKIFFAIPVPWFQRWLAFVRNDVGPLGRGAPMGVLPPGEIDLSSFLENDGKTLKGSLKSRTHYIMVSHPLLRFWEQAYGLKGEPQARYGVDLYGPPAAKADIEAEMEVTVETKAKEVTNTVTGVF